MVHKKETVALLMSRQPLRPCRQTVWVRRTVQAVQWVKERGGTLVSSVGMQTWELMTALSSIERIPIHLILTPRPDLSPDETVRTTLRQFDLVHQPVSVDLLPETHGNKTRTDALRQRDQQIIRSADRLLPIAISDRGGMARLINEADSGGKEVDRRFEAPCEKRTDKLAYNLNSAHLQQGLAGASGQFIVHWTRSCNSAWPDERLIDYYRDVLLSDHPPRSAMNTLLRILQSRRVLSSSRHMPRGEKTVSFSELSPKELVPLIKWRARYRQMSFEPYGVGIRKELAHELGIRPVKYYQTGRRSGRTNVPDWLSQSMGTVTDWRREKELRHRGDLDLANVPDKDICAFCHTSTEATLISELTGLRTESFVL